MRPSLKRIRGYRVLPAILAITWLPYITTRCVENSATHVGCHILPGAVHAKANAARHSHGRSSIPPHAGQQQRRHAHTCCGVTGKCNVRAVSATPHLDPPVPPATLPLVAAAVVSTRSSYAVRDISLVAHSPPTYLGNVTLLL
jgi:hypothetical protein